MQFNDNKITSSFLNSFKTRRDIPVVAAVAAAFPTPAILALAEYSWSFCARSCTNCFASVRVAPWFATKPRGWTGRGGVIDALLSRLAVEDARHPFRTRASTIPTYVYFSHFDTVRGLNGVGHSVLPLQGHVVDLGIFPGSNLLPLLQELLSV